MIYITGDKHGDFYEVEEFCKYYNTSKKDIMIVLGDAGINYYLDERDYLLKDKLSEIPITLFLVHGNHEERPYNIKTYKTKRFHNGIVYYEPKYLNLLFAKDGEIYKFNNNNAIVIGGAYSVDKYCRLYWGDNWFESEQPNDEIKSRVISNLEKEDNRVDIILSHTCPYKYIPHEKFIDFIDQSTVDNSTELFLDEIEDKVNYGLWYCGHFHTDKREDNIIFMHHDIDVLKRVLRR